MPPEEETTQPAPTGGEMPPVEESEQGPSEGTPATLAEAQAELERARAALRKANRESAERRRRLQELETAETARRQAELTETERLKQQLADAQAQAQQAQAQARETLIRTAVEMAAARAGFQTPADALALADLSGVSVDDAGQVQGVEAAIKALAKDRAYLLKTQSPGIGTPPPARKPAASERVAPSAPLVRF
jgi:multidrug efflux pump subunit AcrA (membrane-fusion protein)